MMKFYITLFMSMLVTVALLGQEFNIHVALTEDSEMNGWTEEEAPEIYKGDKLFDLIDGGADLYFEYGFDRVVAYRFKHDNGSRITGELYKMTDDSAAYGLYSLLKPQEGESLELEREGLLSSHYLSFWRGDYFGMLSGDLEGETGSETLVHLAQMFSRKIGGQSEYPELAKTFMNEGHRVIYFKGNLALSNVYAFDYKDIFEIEDGIILKDNESISIIFRYGAVEKAKEVYKRLQQLFSDHRKFSDFKEMDAYFKMTDRKDKTVTFSQRNKYIIGVIHPDPNFGTERIDILNKTLGN